MPTRPELRRAFLLYILNILNSRYIYGYPGRLETDGSVTFQVPGRPGYIYVTIWRGDKITIDKAVNGGANPNPNLLVQMERINGVLTILRPDPSAAARLYEDFASMAFIPPHVGSIGSGIDDPVEGRRFIPGLVAPSAAGGLKVRVFPCFTQAGYFAGNDSFTITAPGTASTRAWVIIYISSANVLTHAVSTTHHAGTSGLLSESLLSTEFTLPNNATPLGAVVVANGGSVSDQSQFADFRFHMARNNLFDSISALTSDTPALNDLYPFADVSDSNNPKKSTLQLVYNAVNLLTAETAPATNDKLAMYDTSGSATDGITNAAYFTIVSQFTTTALQLTDLLLFNDVSASNAAIKNTIQAVFNLIPSLAAETAPATDDTLAMGDTSASSTDSITLVNLFKVVASFSNVVAALLDRIPIADVSDSNNAKYVTVQSVQDSIGLLSTDTPDPEVDSLAFFDNSGSATDRALMKNVPSALQVMKVRNTSGTTAAAQDVGYINGSNEYKTTTTANDPNMVTGGCVVLVGAANNSDIYVMRRGRVTLKLNANCSIGDKLFSSTTAGQASVSTTMRPEMFAIAQTANASGAGGTCEALLYTNTNPIFTTNANDILRVDNHSTTDFVALINAGGSGGLTATNVPYDNISAGAENVIKPQTSANLGKMRLYNSTRSNYRLIDSVNTTTDVIATVSSIDDWADNDTITIVSPSVATGAAPKAIEVDMSQASVYPPLTRAMIIDYTEYDAAAGNVAGAVHPLETYSGQKDSTNYTQAAATPAAKGDINMPMIDNAFTFYSAASGGATKITVLRLRGFFVAAP